MITVGEWVSKKSNDSTYSVGANSIEVASNFSVSPKFYILPTLGDSIIYSRDADNIETKPIIKSKVEPLDLKGIVDFIFNRLVYEDFAYGDTPDLKYVVDGLFRKDKEKAQMAFINMLSMRVYMSESNIIEKFFALLMSIDDAYVDEMAMVIVTVFSSHADQSAAEGALAILDKFGNDANALKIARNIRDFDYQFLNEYKQAVIDNLSMFDE